MLVLKSIVDFITLCAGQKKEGMKECCYESLFKKRQFDFLVDKCTLTQKQFYLVRKSDYKPYLNESVYVCGRV